MNLNVHDLYKNVFQDYSRVFKLLDNGTILLLAHCELKSLSPKDTPYILGIFECLLNETTKQKHFDDAHSKDQIPHQDDYLLVMKPIGILLINHLKYNKLSTDKLESVASFTCKVIQHCLSTTALLDAWFDVALKEPDVVYLLYKNRLPANCFPPYEIAKDFLFMGDLLFQISKEALLSIVLASGFNKNLENWILMSEFPGLVITGLLSNFNQICYNEILLSNYKNDFDEILLENENFKEFNEYIKFIMDILSYSTHDSVKIVFLNCFQSRFINPVLEYYSLNDTYHVNIIFLLSHTINQLISIPEFSRSCPITQFIVEELIEKCIDTSTPNKTSLIDIFKDALLQPTENTILTISSFNLLSSFCKARQVSLVLKLFGFEPFIVDIGACVIKSDSNTNDLCNLVKLIEHGEPSYKTVLVDKLEEGYTWIYKVGKNGDPQNPTSSRTWLKFDFSKELPLLILSHFVRFFTNPYTVNRSLLNLLKCITSFNHGKIFDFVLNDTSGPTETFFYEIFTFLWNSLEDYSSKYYCGRVVAPIVTPTSHILYLFRSYDKVIADSLEEWYKQGAKNPIKLETLALNMELFKGFVKDLYSIHKTRNLEHRVFQKLEIPKSHEIS